MSGFGELADLSEGTKRINALIDSEFNSLEKKTSAILDTNALSAWADGLSASEAALDAVKMLVLPVIVLGEFEFVIRQSRHRQHCSD